MTDYRDFYDLEDLIKGKFEEWEGTEGTPEERARELIRYITPACNTVALRQRPTHNVYIRGNQMPELRKWLENPNGAKMLNSRARFNAVEGGGISVTTHPYSHENGWT